MIKTGRHRILSKEFWLKETFSGGLEYRKRTITLITVLFAILAALFYVLLVFIGGTENGPEILMVLAYAIGVLLVAMIGLVIIISLIEYLRSFEK